MYITYKTLTLLYKIWSTSVAVNNFKDLQDGWKMIEQLSQKKNKVTGKLTAGGCPSGRVRPQWWTTCTETLTVANVHSPHCSQQPAFLAQHPLKQTIHSASNWNADLNRTAHFQSLFFSFLFFLTPNEKSEIENNERVLCSIICKGHGPSEAKKKNYRNFLLVLARPFFCLFFFSFSGTAETKHSHVCIYGTFSQIMKEKMHRALCYVNIMLIFRVIYSITC